MARTVIEAAGCVLWRRSSYPGAVEFALVHRPKWDDWSHPKGKLKRGESAETAALREVLEETGYVCALGVRLPPVHYEAEGRAKTVSYWVAEAVSGAFVPNDEVDHLIWLPPEMARSRLTHPRDRALIDEALPELRRPASGG